jgi:hypothetical protein
MSRHARWLACSTGRKSNGSSPGTAQRQRFRRRVVEDPDAARPGSLDERAELQFMVDGNAAPTRTDNAGDRSQDSMMATSSHAPGKKYRGFRWRRGCRYGRDRGQGRRDRTASTSSSCWPGWARDALPSAADVRARDKEETGKESWVWPRYALREERDAGVIGGSNSQGKWRACATMSSIARRALASAGGTRDMKERTRERDEAAPASQCELGAVYGERTR